MNISDYKRILTRLLNRKYLIRCNKIKKSKEFRDIEKKSAYFRHEYKRCINLLFKMIPDIDKNKVENSEIVEKFQDEYEKTIFIRNQQQRAKARREIYKKYGLGV